MFKVFEIHSFSIPCSRNNDKLRFKEKTALIGKYLQLNG